MAHGVPAFPVPQAALAAASPATMAPPPAVEKSEAPRLPWVLPERGLAVFHGHPDVPRLFHYFLPRLMAQGKAVLCLDGANRPPSACQFAETRKWNPKPPQNSILQQAANAQTIV